MPDKESPGSSHESLAVIGGGMMGIMSALKLAASGRYRVSLYEKEIRLGGLSSAYQWRDISWDRFYHVILSTDKHLLEFINKLNLRNEIFWKETKTGFYSQGRLVSFSSSFDFIKFPFISFWQKCRMVYGILYSSRIKDPSKLENTYVRSWMISVFGRRLYEQIWDPLLRSKLGDARQRTSAAFMWATITRLYGARSSGEKRERMGHVRGGYDSILQAAKKKLDELGVRVITGTPVSKIERLTDASSASQDNPAGDSITVKGKKTLRVIAGEGTSTFDKVLFTIPCREVLRLFEVSDSDPYYQKLQQVEYLGIACVFLVLTRRLSPYYVINLLDPDLPFTGIIEATNVVSSESLNGRHLVYLPKYMTQDDPVNDYDDDRIISLFVKKLKKVFPDLKDEEIIHSKVFREKYVQPLQELNYSDRIAGIRSPDPAVYLVNTSMIYNSTLNNNAVAALADTAAMTILNDK